MKKIIWIFVLISLISYGETIKIATIDWCPQICVKLEDRGYMIDILELVFENSFYDLEYEFYPWSRAIFLTERGEVDALLAPAKREAPTLIYPEEEIGVQTVSFFVKVDNPWQYTGISSLEGIRIGASSDVSMEELSKYMEKNRDRIEYLPYNDAYIMNSIEKLETERIDTFVFTYNTVIFMLNDMGIEDSYKYAGSISEATVYLAFTPVDSEGERVDAIMEFFDKRMKSLHADGSIEKIMKVYGLSDWK